MEPLLTFPAALEASLPSVNSSTFPSSRSSSPLVTLAMTETSPKESFPTLPPPGRKGNYKPRSQSENSKKKMIVQPTILQKAKPSAAANQTNGSSTAYVTGTSTSTNANKEGAAAVFVPFSAGPIRTSRGVYLSREQNPPELRPTDKQGYKAAGMLFVRQTEAGSSNAHHCANTLD